MGFLFWYDTILCCMAKMINEPGTYLELEPLLELEPALALLCWS
jgi:hypothetical protein